MLAFSASPIRLIDSARCALVSGDILTPGLDEAVRNWALSPTRFRRAGVAGVLRHFRHAQHEGD
jgi:hypothetical protein